MSELILDHFQIVRIAKILVAVFLAILFVQSGGDKLIHWKENKEYFKNQFKGTFLIRFVTMALAKLAFLELSAGLLCFAGSILLVFEASSQIALWGYILSAVSFLALLFGQRCAKDYAGAAVLPGYFLISVAGIVLYLL